MGCLTVAAMSGACPSEQPAGTSLAVVGAARDQLEQVYEGPVGGVPLWFGMFAVSNTAATELELRGIEALGVDEGVEILPFWVYAPSDRHPEGLIDGDCGDPSGLPKAPVAGYRIGPGEQVGVIVHIRPPTALGVRGISGLRIRYSDASGRVLVQTFPYRVAGENTGGTSRCGTDQREPSATPA